MYYQMYYAIKIILVSEEILYLEKGDMILRTLLILKGQKRKGISSSRMHRAERGKRMKEFSTTQ